MAYDPTYDPYAEDPYYAWARQQQLAALQAPDPLALSADAGRKGGSTSGGTGTGHDQIAQAVVAPPQELPAGALKDEPEKPNQPEEPDAVSGADRAPGVGTLTDVTAEAPQSTNIPPPPTSPDYIQWAQQHAAQQPLPSMQENDAMASAKAEQQAIASMSPEEYIQWQGERAGRMRDMQVQRQSDIEAENQRRLQENVRLQQQAYATAQAKTADLMAQAHALAQEKVVVPKPSILNALGIIVGGMFSNGGPNQALAAFNRKVDNDIAAQHANIQNQFRGLEMQKTAIGDEYARSGDLYHAQEVYRVAAYEQAIQGMQTELQKYDPNGATAAMIRDGLDKFHAAQSAAIQDYNKNQLENEYKRAQTAQAYASAMKTATETDKLRTQMSGAGAGAAPAAPVLQPDYFTSLGLAKPPAAMSMDAYKEWLGLSKQSAEAGKAIQDTASNANAGVISKPHGDFAPITGKDGQPVRIAPDVAKELNAQNVGAQNVVSDLNDIKRMLEEDPSVIDRKKWAEIQGRVGQSMAAMAHYFGAKFSSKEEEAIRDITHLDYDSFYRKATAKGTGVASINGIIDTVKRSVDTENSAILHQPVSGMLSDVGSAPKPKPTEVDDILAKLSTPNPTTADPSKLVQLYTTPEEQQRMPAGPLLTLAQGRAAQNPAPGNSDRDALLSRAKVFANAAIQKHSGRYYLVDDSGRDISGVAPVDTEAEGAALLAKYRDTARAGLAKLAGDSEDSNIREGAGADVLGRATTDALRATEAP